jgi:hypothetical protein
MPRYLIKDGAPMHQLDGVLAYAGEVVEWSKKPISRWMVRLDDDGPQGSAADDPPSSVPSPVAAPPPAPASLPRVKRKYTKRGA